MAVPKKKISYSRTRKRLLSKAKKLRLYIECTSCSNFVKLHHLCSYCSLKGLSSHQIDGNFKTNINKVLNVDL